MKVYMTINEISENGEYEEILSFYAELYNIHILSKYNTLIKVFENTIIKKYGEEKTIDSFYIKKKLYGEIHPEIYCCYDNNIDGKISWCLHDYKNELIKLEEGYMWLCITSPQMPKILEVFDRYDPDKNEEIDQSISIGSIIYSNNYIYNLATFNYCNIKNRIYDCKICNTPGVILNRRAYHDEFSTYGNALPSFWYFDENNYKLTIKDLCTTKFSVGYEMVKKYLHHLFDDCLDNIAAITVTFARKLDDQVFNGLEINRNVATSVVKKYYKWSDVLDNGDTPIIYPLEIESPLANLLEVHLEWKKELPSLEIREKILSNSLDFRRFDRNCNPYFPNAGGEPDFRRNASYIFKITV